MGGSSPYIHLPAPYVRGFSHVAVGARALASGGSDLKVPHTLVPRLLGPL